MKADIRQHLLTLVLGGAITVLTGPALVAQSSNAQTPSPQPPAATTNAAAQMKVDIAGDQQQVQALKEKVANDQAKMQSDIKQFGKNSTEVKADAAALKADREQARTLRRDLKHDEHIVDKVDERAARNLKKDTAELKTLGEQMQDEHAKLSSDGQKYGRDSAQVKADEASMTRMQQDASGLRNHIHKDNVQLSRLGGGGRRH